MSLLTRAAPRRQPPRAIAAPGLGLLSHANLPLSEPNAPPKHPLADIPPPSGTKVTLVLLAILAGVCLSCTAMTVLYAWYLDVHGGR